jgi:adenosylcobinamide-GDP ribazoletransferase
MQGFLRALGFLTLLPVPGAGKGGFRGAVPFFPIVGLLLGLILAALDQAMNRLVPTGLASALLLLASILLTRGFHLDGLMDTCDGLGVVGPREERLRAMKDSRVGAFGVMGCVLLLFIKYSSLYGLAREWRPQVLALFPLVGRGCLVSAVALFPAARKEGLGRVFKEETRVAEVVLAGLLTVLIAFAIAGLSGLFLLVGSWVVSLIGGLWFSRAFGGMTGDTYGAINEVAETTALVAATLFSGR